MLCEAEKRVEDSAGSGAIGVTETMSAHRSPLPAVAAAILAPVVIWSYWPTLVRMVSTWSSEPDYSHGYLVIPIALAILWVRRHEVSSPRRDWGVWGGVVLVAGSVVLRSLGGVLHLDPMDGLTIPVCIGGIVWFLGGRQRASWAFPAIAFLWFMIPLPWRVERFLAVPMQKLAAYGGAWLLQCLGQPALAKGDTVLIGNCQLEVAQACSGLRTLLGVLALAFVCLVLIRRPWWQKLLWCVCVPVVAVAANMVRIAATGFIYQHWTSEAQRAVVHQWGGWGTVGVSVLLFWAMQWWLDRLFVRMDACDLEQILRHESGEPWQGAHSAQY